MVAAAQSRFRGPLSRILGLMARRFKRALLTALDYIDSRLVGRGVFFLATRLFPKTSTGPYGRRVLDGAQPTDPLSSNKNTPSIEVVIVAAEKDFECLPLCVNAAQQNVKNPIDQVRLVVPSSAAAEAKKLSLDAKVVEEEALLPEKLMKAVDEHHPAGRRGWVLQQVLGLWACLQSPYKGALLLDADTVLTRSRHFLSWNGCQLLSLSHEYEATYEKHAEGRWGARQRHHGLSYVTHHQLFQPELLREMFPDADSLEMWIRSASRNTPSPLSEYHSYGRWLMDNYPERVRLGRWRNKALHRSQVMLKDPTSELAQLSGRFPHSLSVSLHTYL